MTQFISNIYSNLDNNIIFGQQQLDKYNNNRKHDDIPENPNSTPTPSPIGALPDEIILRFMSFLGVKELGKVAQVSKAFFAAANNEGLWERQCRNQPEYVDITQLAANQNSYKLLYKNETDISRFLQNGNLLMFLYKNANIKTNTFLTFENINFNHPELRGKHLQRMIKWKALQNPSTWKGIIDADTPLSHIHIYVEGTQLKDEMRIDPRGFILQTHNIFKVSNPTPNS